MPRTRPAKRPTREPEQVERDARAVELRKRHLSYDQIAAELGLKAKSSAYEAVRRGLADSVVETNDEVRQQELERYDELARRAMLIMATRHYKISNGQLIQHPETHEYLLDPMPTLKAIETLIRISMQRAELTGIKAPIQVEMITMNSIDSEIARLAAELAARSVPK